LPRFNPGVTEGPVEFGTVAARSFFAVSMMLWLLFVKTWLLEFVRFRGVKTSVRNYCDSGRCFPLQVNPIPSTFAAEIT
jgi:hypothetical protein